MSTLWQNVARICSNVYSIATSSTNSRDLDEQHKVCLQKILGKLNRHRSSRSRVSVHGVLALLITLLALLFIQSQDPLSLKDFPGRSLSMEQLVQKQRLSTKYLQNPTTIAGHVHEHSLTAYHPVIMIPGITTTGLESWSTEPASKRYFRKRLWGSWTMMRALITDKAEWKRHIMLDQQTGLDPHGIKLRAAQGFSAIDCFIRGYWIWDKVIQKLASIGYAPSNAIAAPYDWRLAPISMEQRDSYFTRLKTHIEVTKASNDGRKAVVISHSVGSQVFFFFMKWVEHIDHGTGGPTWVDDHIDSWINVSGTLLGAAKAVSMALSGEMKETTQLNKLSQLGLESLLSREERVQISRSLPGAATILPRGGETIWGKPAWGLAESQQSVDHDTFVSLPNQRDEVAHMQRNATIVDSIAGLLSPSDAPYVDMVGRTNSFGVAHTKAEVERNEDDIRKWLNPLETRLPDAPQMKVFCFYGIDKPTERAYLYRNSPNSLRPDADISIDTSVSTEDAKYPRPGAVNRGVLYEDGDGTVNLISLGYMCAKGWRNIKRYNPAGIKIVTHEMLHKPNHWSSLRGGPDTGDHIDILGRKDMLDLILNIVGGKGSQVEDNFGSNILEMSEKVQIFDD